MQVVFMWDGLIVFFVVMLIGLVLVILTSHVEKQVG
jgi:hypothetical protein